MQEAPDLHMGLEFYFQAFFEISGDRPIGFGMGPIPYLSLHQYARLNGIDNEEDLEDFIYFLREMDQEFLAYNQEEAARKSKTTPPSRSKGR